MLIFNILRCIGLCIGHGHAYTVKNVLPFTDKNSVNLQKMCFHLSPYKLFSVQGISMELISNKDIFVSQQICILLPCTENIKCRKYGFIGFFENITTCKFTEISGSKVARRSVFLFSPKNDRFLVKIQSIYVFFKIILYKYGNFSVI